MHLDALPREDRPGAELSQLLCALARSTTESQLVDALERHGRQALDCDALCWIEPTPTGSRCRAESAMQPRPVARRAPWNEWLSASAPGTGEPFVVEDAQLDPQAANALLHDPHLRSAVVARLVSEELEGALEAHWYRPHPPNAREVDALLALAATLSLALENLALRVRRVASSGATREHELAERLRHAEKMDVVGQLAGGVAHDFNNLLAPMLAYSDWLIRQPEFPEKFQGDLEAVLEAAHRAKGLVQQLLAFGRKQLLDVKPLDLGAEIRVLERMLRRVIHEDVNMDFRLGDRPYHVLADRTQLQQVLMNLAVNAQDAMPQGGTLRIETALVELDESVPLPPGDYVQLTVIDTGTGISEDARARIFEPFYTTKRPGHGTGLGLSTVKNIVVEQGGHIACESVEGAGTTFRIWLPLSRLRAAPTPIPPKIESAKSESILVVEDDAMVRDLARRILERGGYKVLVAANLLEAQTRITENDGHVDLLVSDLILPHANGRQVFEALSRELEGLRVLYMSGYAPDVLETRTALEAGVKLLKKPFGVDQLLQAVRVALDQERA